MSTCEIATGRSASQVMLYCRRPPYRSQFRTMYAGSLPQHNDYAQPPSTTHAYFLSTHRLEPGRLTPAGRFFVTKVSKSFWRAVAKS